ncbi:membrane or secreted protein [Pontibacter sp. H249]|uniref:membrane or secreted protein n=1 Tax=Pontibacter sp. H249 TaxID=3133420 RepID=UPI0030BA3A6F
MRKNILLQLSGIAAISLSLLVGFKAPETAQQHRTENLNNVQTNSLEGAWRLTGATDGTTTIKIVQDGFFTVAVYDQENKRFIGTYGGTYTLSNNQLTQKYEFNTFDSTQVGNAATGKFTLKNNTWQISGLGRKNKANESWERLSKQNTASPLAGTWRITGRERNGEMSTMQQGARKTLKVLSDTRFQWIAFNSETGEFFGTGGGTYTAKDGKYTESIEFFSRDSSRVGMQLSFNYEVKDGRWHHTGQSSTGNKINEIWERITAN